MKDEEKVNALAPSQTVPTFPYSKPYVTLQMFYPLNVVEGVSDIYILKIVHVY